MQIKALFLLAPLFAFGCGEKSDEERLDDLVERCHSFMSDYNRVVSECGLTNDLNVDCDEGRELIKDNECIDQTEAALDCADSQDYASLQCDDDIDAALQACAEPAFAWIECMGL
tara:strand:+ start:103 stop:447 length:345 start_codon:yes stop_codon:yes gene_type:complete